MDYYTSESQERELNEKYMVKVKEIQDQNRVPIGFGLQKNRKFTYIPEPDRIFIIENEKVYLGQVDEKNICPQGYIMGGRSYGIDYMFMNEVQEFVKRHKKYMVIFNVSGRYDGTKKYCGGQGIYPARMIADFEELILEDEEKYISQF